MTTTLNASMFDQIKQSLSPKKGESIYKDILKFEAGKTYIVRLVPNLSNLKDTFYHYYHHSWKSLATNNFITALCPSTYGEPCPIDTYAFRVYRNGSDEEKKNLNQVTRKENWLVNVYVIQDPTNPDNEGKVKIMRYGRELDKIITSAISGDEADEFGAKVFDIQDGCSLKIKCEHRSDGRGGGKSFMVTYAASRFMNPGSLGLSKEELENVHKGIHDLTAILPRKKQSELQDLLNKHYLLVEDEQNNDEDSVITETKKSVKKDVPEPLSVFEGIEEASGDSSDTDGLNLDEQLKNLLSSDDE